MNNKINIIGKTLSIRKLLEFIKKSAKTDANILLLGETGVGKELAARMIHSYSERKNRPFIKINCANLNENLLESELFGYKRGAYTGAFIDKPGLIEEAHGGIFVLDEVADISPYIQAKLLNVIEEKEFRRLGETRIRKIDIQFIFATNKDLFNLVERGKFRRDLFYRISLLTFFIPPLRERKEDIPLIAGNIMREENKKNKNSKRITQCALNKLLAYDYPGNVRELENIIKKAYFFSDNNEIEERDIELGRLRGKTSQNIPEIIYEKIIKENTNFWEAVHRPFLKRELNKREVKEIIALGLKQTNGSYKEILPLFNIDQTEKDYKRFMDIIRIYELR